MCYINLSFYLIKYDTHIFLIYSFNFFDIICSSEVERLRFLLRTSFHLLIMIQTNYPHPESAAYVHDVILQKACPSLSSSPPSEYQSVLQSQ